MRKKIWYEILEEIKPKENESIFSLSFVKNYLRVSHNHDDELLQLLITAAIERAEQYTAQQITQKIVKVHIPALAEVNEMNYAPLKRIEEVIIEVEHDKEKVSKGLAISRDGKAIILREEGFIGKKAEIIFLAGYSPHLLPSHFKEGILYLISRSYESDILQASDHSLLASLFSVHRKVRI